MFRIIQFAVAICLSLFSVRSMSAEPQTLVGAAELNADVDVLQRVYESMHPGLYRYNSKAQMAANFSELRSDFDHDQTLADAYLALSRFTAKVRCGHTYPNFFNQTKWVTAELFLHADRLPFLFRWLDRRMVVTGGVAPGTNLQPGTEVLSIDGIPVGSILDRLMAYSRADGSNDAKRIANLEVTGIARYEAFDIYYPMVFPVKGSTRELRVRSVSGSESTVTVDLISPEQRAADIAARDAALHGGDAPIWTLERLDARTSILRMPTWVVYDSKWDWKRWLDRSFDRLVADRVPNLIIDLRNNEGGSGVGDEIIAHLIPKNLPLPGYVRLVRYRKVASDVLPYLDTWDHSFDDWGSSAVDDGNGFYRLTRYDDDPSGNVIKARGTHYKGKVWVLVNASNSSATFEFELVAQQYKLATLVGQPTGGNRRGINGGAFYFLRLPNSKIEIDLPLIGQFPIALAADEGLQPDIEVIPSIEGIAAGEDSEINQTRKRIADKLRER
jgi:hypothetical protein